jgi:hypothetical protein
MMKLVADWLTYIFQANGQIETLMKYAILSEKEQHLPRTLLLSLH